MALLTSCHLFYSPDWTEQATSGGTLSTLFKIHDMVKQLVLGYNLVQKQLKNQSSIEKKDSEETESKKIDSSLCNIFGFGAEITRLSLVKIVQVSSRMG